MLKTLTTFLNANPWLNLVFLILAVAGIAVSFLLYVKGRKEKILVYAMKSFNLIHNTAAKVPGLSVSHEGKTINTLTLTKIAFWNKGRGTINREDIAPTDRLAVFPQEEVAILDASIAYKSRDSNNFALERIGSRVVVDFDYIDFHQGVVIDVYHTGETDAALILRGTVKGGHDLIGAIPQDYLLDKTLGKVSSVVPSPSNSLLRFVRIVILLIIILIPGMIIMAIDVAYRMANRLPTEFELSAVKGKK